MTKRTRILSILLVSGSLAAFPSCQKSESASRPAPKQEAVVVGRENATTAQVAVIMTGPIISGTLRAEKEATVRAEVSGAVLAVNADEGQPVRKGMLLARIEDRALRDAVVSVQSAVRSAENALSVAQREEERTRRLIEAGALAERDLDNARNAVAGAQAQLADVRARLVSAQEQLAKTTIFAPISGVISGQPVNSGDVVTPGTVLFVIVDPSQLELEAMVPSEELPNLRIGSPVEFQIRGSSGSTVSGRIQRISPTADPVTRQVSIFVSVPNRDRRLVAGLFAQGRVATERREALVVPSQAIDTDDPDPWVLRLKDGRTERVPVHLGLKDTRTERVEILSGVQPGDVLLVGPAQHITPGTPVELNGHGGQPPAEGRAAKENR